jgi:anti-sigma B factor antagonist
MNFDFNRRGYVSTLFIGGELDALTTVELRPIISSIGRDRPSRVIVDLSQLRLIDGSGVGALVGLYKAVRGYDGSLAVVGVRDQPLAILRLLQLDRVLIRNEA